MATKSQMEVISFVDKTNDQIAELVHFAKRFCSDQQLNITLKIDSFPANCNRNITFQKIASHTKLYYDNRRMEVTVGDKEILIVIEDFNTIKITNDHEK